MCDTLAALPSTTARNALLFGKNSDRERNEAQGLTSVAAAHHSKGAMVKLTYIEIEQATQTYACLISRPFWMWGAEMGANEHGVVIGNEAMHAKIPAQRKAALTGMDLVRLGLERARTAAQAVEIITGLLERHGQGGDCGHLGRSYYQNGFLIADPTQAYVLETVGRWWAVERVEQTRSLSNALSIGQGAIAVSADLGRHARAQGWTDAHGVFDFAERLIDPVKDAATFGRGRCARSAGLLTPRVGRLDLRDVFSVLRDHGQEADHDPLWSPRKTKARSICMHAAAGPRRSQSVASMASELKADRMTHWVTGTSAPCLSLFKPVVLGLGPKTFGPAPTDQFNPQTLWWAHERLHRLALHDFPAALAQISPLRDELEDRFLNRMDEAWALGPEAVGSATAACWREARRAQSQWGSMLSAAKRKGASTLGRPAALAWARLNTVAGLPHP